jgi:NitT/TauT family transport system permease protein
MGVRLGSWAALIALLACWEGAARWAHVPMWLLPTPSEIMAAAWRVRSQLPVHIVATVGATLEGFAAAVIIGVLLAALLAASEFVRRLLDPLLAGMQAVPKNALAPIFILWFGGGELSKIAITFLISFFPIVVNTTNGLERVDRDALYLTKTLRASTWQTFLHVRLPNAVPSLLAGCKIAITLAIVGAVIAEFVGSDVGLGYLILISSSQLQTDVAFVAITALALCGILLFWAVGLIEAAVLPRLGIPPKEDGVERGA